MKMCLRFLERLQLPKIVCCAIEASLGQLLSRQTGRLYLASINRSLRSLIREAALTAN